MNSGPRNSTACGDWACGVTSSGVCRDYVRDFDQKWLKAKSRPQQSPLGTADLQSLADLGNGVNVVRAMRLAPMSARLVQDLLIVAVLPMLPLLLFKYPIADLMQKFFSSLVGL